jgi:hypothetical protein
LGFLIVGVDESVFDEVGLEPRVIEGPVAGCVFCGFGTTIVAPPSPATAAA